MKKTAHIALVGNPNCGKSSLFNELTGLNQKVGNFPGVTVDKKLGQFSLSKEMDAELLDLPGTYSVYPRRADEWVTYQVLLNANQETPLDLVVLLMDASNIRRNLLFCSQILDLKFPVVVALTMNDLAAKQGIQIDVPGLERELGVPVVPVNPRKHKGIESLKKVMEQTIQQQHLSQRPDFIYNVMLAPEAIRAMQQQHPEYTDYQCLHYLINGNRLLENEQQKTQIEAWNRTYKFNSIKTQAEEIMQRYARIKHIMQQVVVESDPLRRSLITEKLDNILLHRKAGYAILLLVLFLLFQSVDWLAAYPMDLIEQFFAWFSQHLKLWLPVNWFTDLLINGVLSGLSGIFVFVPQIMILFGLITALEDSGYMARISFLTDKLMRKAGLNGKSVMPMISGLACAVPAILSARSIENRKERLMTILVTPLMSCSARLPVYIILTGLVIPQERYFGFISLQGLVMMFLYFFGTAMAILVAWVLKWFVKSTERSFFILELPVYRSPRWKNLAFTMYEKAKIFVVDAGKVILIISVLLWFLSNQGPEKNMQAVRETYATRMQFANEEELLQLKAEEKNALLQNSYAGQIGQGIEPVIKPLGFDWKIGIALITSFAAREVFVGTMATLYSAGDEADEHSDELRSKMAAAEWPDGTKVYTLATGMSLLIFYVLAMQCMSTLAVVKRETKTWKWPLIQLAYMTALAYLCSWLTYLIFS